MMFMEDYTVLVEAWKAKLSVEGCVRNTAGKFECQTDAQLAKFNAAATAFDRGEVGSSFQNFLYWQTYNMKWSFFAGYDLLATAAGIYISAISQKMLAAAKPTAAA